MVAKAFTGGDKLTARLKEMAAKLNKKGTLEVGWMADTDVYPDGTNTAMVAAIQEFGAPGASIPPRPFFRPMIAKESGGWGDTIEKQLVATNYDTDATLGRMGEEISGQLQESIQAVDSPPLSPITLMLKKMRSEDQNLVVTGKVVGEAAARVKAGEDYSGQSEKPLIDTGHLWQSVKYTVKS